MANEELELDVEQPKKSKKTLIIIIVLVNVLLIGGITAWFLLAGNGGGDSSAKSGEKADKNLGPLIYQTLVPEFVVNFGPGSKVRYLQIDIQIATRDEAALQTVTTYNPVIRNNILILLSGQSFEDLRARDGKVALQKKILNAINKVVASAGHAAPAADEKDGNGHAAGGADGENTSQNEDVDGPIENIYFTSFVMQ